MGCSSYHGYSFYKPDLTKKLPVSTIGVGLRRRGKGGSIRKIKRCIRHCSMHTQSLHPKVNKLGYAINPYITSIQMWWTYK